MKSRRSIWVIALFLFSIPVFSQVEEPVKPESKEKAPKEKLSFKDRLVFGGDLGLSVGTYTYINVSPVIGYRLTDRFTAGVGIVYIYEHYRDFNLESSTYGGKILASFTVLRGSDIGGKFGFGDIVLHAENEVVNVQPLLLDQSIPSYFYGSRRWIDNLLVGGGLRQSLGGRFSVSIYILWDLTQNPYSQYSNPIFRIGFGF
jgi:hypothetical protein